MASSRQSNGCLLRQVRVCLAKDARVVLADGCALWLRAVAETVALAAHADTQLHKTMREVQRRIAHSTREREHAQICDLLSGPVRVIGHDVHGVWLIHRGTPILAAAEQLRASTQDEILAWQEVSAALDGRPAAGGQGRVSAHE